MAIILNGTTGITSPGGDVSVSQSLSGNLVFTGTGNRITGDFSNATVANRLIFQTSTVNSNTTVGAIPNGSSQIAVFEAYNNPTDLNNSNTLQFGVVGTTDARINARNLGTASATPLPMTFYTGGSERLRVDTSGNVGIGTTSPGTKLDVIGPTGSVAAPAYLNQTSASIRNNWHSRLALVNGGTVFSGSIDSYATGASYPSVSLGLDNDGVVRFVTGSGSVATTEKVRITSAGDVGIGTSSPQGRLHVVNGYAGFQYNSNGAYPAYNTYFSAIGHNFSSGGSEVDFWNTVGSGFVFRKQTGASAQTALMTLDASGNLGLGVTPSAWGIQFKALQSGASTNSSSIAFQTGEPVANILANAYYDGSNYKYINSSQGASQYRVGHNGGTVASGFAWSVAPSGTAGNAISFTQAMTLDADGDLGVGTTNPVINSSGRTVHVNAPAGQWSLFHATNGDTGAGAADGLIVGAIGTEGYVFNYEASSLIFGTSASERARIDSSGNLLVGSSADIFASGRVQVTTSSFGVNVSEIATDGGGAAFGANRTSSDGWVAGWYRAGAGVGSIAVTSTATTYNTTSDYRLKENVQLMTGALAKVSALKPCTYTWKSDGSDGEGFIAHELQAVCPQAVTGEKDAVDADGNPKYQGVDTSFLVATLTAAIQELKAEVDSLKAQLQGAA